MLYDLSFLNEGKIFPPLDEIDRLKRYNENRLLWEGEHKQIFRERYNQLFTPDEQVVWQFNFNWYERVSNVFASLLFGEPPKIRTGEPGSKEQEFVNNLISDDFIVNSFNVAIDVSRYGTGIYKPVLNEGKVIIDSLSPAFWFPVLNVKTLKKITHNIVAWNIGDRLYVEIHTPGMIENREYLMQSGIIKKLLNVSQVKTGVNEVLIIPVQNTTTSESIFGKDDYQKIDTIICELEVRFSQLAKILDKHANPTMYGPRTLIQTDKRTGQPFVDIVGKFLGISPNEITPSYLVWDAQLSAVFQEISELMTQFYALSETAPALFGDLKQGLAESGSALKRLLISPLAKVNRLRLSFDIQIKKAISIASKLAVANNIPNSVVIEPNQIHIDWQDGLPVDAREQMDIEATAVSTGLSSKQSAMARIYGLEGESLIQEKNRIKEEQIQTSPPEVNLPTIEEKIKELNG